MRRFALRAAFVAAYGRPPEVSTKDTARPTSHHCTHVPRHEFVLAVPMLLAFRRSARGRLQHHPEQPLADLRDRRIAVDDRAAIEIDVLFLAHPQRGVRRQLERW